MSLRVTDQSAFILHRREFRDSSLILELFTEYHGRVGVLARAARKRRDSALFQPFNRLVVSWSGRSDLKTLTRIDGRPIDVPANCYLAAFYTNELLLYLMPREDEHRDLFNAYQRLLLELEHARLEPLLRAFEIKLLGELGLMPDLNIESQSGRELEDDRRYVLDMQAGLRAANLEEPESFSGKSLKAIHHGEFDSEEILRGARRLLRQIIDFNLQGRTLQSRRLYQQLARQS